MKIFNAILIKFMFLLGGTQVAHAATRTVCFNRVVVEDARVDCPAHDSGATGIRHKCGSSDSDKEVAANGFLVELWDKDASVAQDDYIGTWVIGSSVGFCATFEWENASYFENETDGPDVYLRFPNAVRKNDGTGWIATAKSGTGGTLSSLMARDQATNNCQTNGTGCTVTAEVKPATSATTSGARIMTLLTAQNALQSMTQAYWDQNFNIWYPNTECDSGCAASRSIIKIPNGFAAGGSLMAHEIGHLWQMRQFSQGGVAQDGLINDCSANGDGWSIYQSTETPEWQSCATTEGFATYAAALIFWNPGSATAPVVFGENMEDASPHWSSCDYNAWLARQLAKGFWDLDDNNNEPGSGHASSWSDTVGVTSDSLIQNWSNFANGTANRQDEEASSNGVNSRDFKENGSMSSAQWTSFAEHNCFHSQVN